VDDPKTLQLTFANRVIRQFVDHLVGADMIVEPRDYMVIRLLFRKGGGTWLDILHGNITHLSFLEKLIASWGKLPGRKRESEDG
jgi:hypothetical protein